MDCDFNKKSHFLRTRKNEGLGTLKIPHELMPNSFHLLIDEINSEVHVRSSTSKYGFFGWNLWRQPIGFLVFLISSLAECERLPFDLPEAEEELVAGYQTEYSGIKYGLFYLVSYLNLLAGGISLFPIYPFLDFFQMNKIIGILEMVIGIFITLTKMDFTQDENGSVINLGWNFFYLFSGQSLINNFFPTSFTINKNTITRKKHTFFIYRFRICSLC
ncbi:hypothetical protein ACJX0J_003165 [Zea mays]